MSELAGWADDYFWGAMVVLRVFAVSLVLAVVIGLIGSAMKLSGSRVAETIANAYTVVFRRSL